MAYTSIHNITATVEKAIAYIINPRKCDGHTSGYNCEPDVAAIEFRMTAALAQFAKGDYSNCGGKTNLAYHMIQSFAPDDKITPEQAHEVGKKWADEFLGGRYEYVIATHVNTGIIHNHIIFNATSFYDFKKFDNYKTQKRMRSISDRLCIENNLSVIEGKGKGKSYYEWSMQKAGHSWKDYLKESIDTAIAQSNSIEEFCEFLKIHGIQVSNLQENEGKYIRFYVEGVDRVCRGRAKTLGSEYTRERITQRIESASWERNHSESQRFGYYIERQSKAQNRARTSELLMVLNAIHSEKLSSEEDIQKRIKTINEQIAQSRESIKAIDEKNAVYKKVASFLATIQKYGPIQSEQESLRGKRQQRFRELHHAELQAYDFAINQLDKMGLNTNIDLHKVLELIRNREQEIDSLRNGIKKIESQIIHLQKVQTVIEDVLRGQNHPDRGQVR